MSPLVIILLILILFVNSARSTTGKKYNNENEMKIFPSTTNHRNSSRLERANYVRIDVGKNMEDPSIARAAKLRQNLQHLLATMATKMIERNLNRATYDPNDARMVKKKIEKKLANEVAGFGKFSNVVERETDGKRDSAKYYGERSEGEGPSEKVSKDLFRVSEALLPTVRRIVRSRFSKVRRSIDGESMRVGIDRDNGSSTARPITRVKRQDNATKDASLKSAWIKRDFPDHHGSLKMHAFIVKDEEIPPCCSVAKPVTDRRYFMCSGAVLTAKHAITTASCIHYADIYERKIEADLAVLIGATGLRAYVIKINRYEMHPEYEYDVLARSHSIHNLAILYLACSVVQQDIIVPSLPKGINDDVAHLCCREGCELITIMESIDNKHTAHVVQAKNLPAPMHGPNGEEEDDDFDDEYGPPQFGSSFNNGRKSSRRFRKPIFSNATRPLVRKNRSPLRLAAAPTFFGEDSRRSSAAQGTTKSAESTTTKKRKKSKSSQRSRGKNQQRDRKKKKLNFDDSMNRGRQGRAQIPIMRALQKQGLNVGEQLASIDWRKVEETVEKKFSPDNRAQIDAFAKNLVDETMRRVENVLGDEDGIGETKENGSSVFQNLMPNHNRNKTIENFVHVFTKVVSNIVTSNNSGPITVSSDAALDEKDLKDPPPSNQECPPLGTPVFAEGVLVGLIAYTCDDVQTWVAWKYVNIARNIDWIEKHMVSDHGQVVLCAGPDMPVHSLRRLAGDVRIANVDKKPSMETETEILGRRFEWKRREATNDDRGSIPTVNPANHGRILGAGTHPRIPKDSWSVGNSPVAPQSRSSEAQQPRWNFANSRDDPRQGTSLGDGPVYNVNTCYVNPDGSTDCRTGGDIDIR